MKLRARINGPRLTPPLSPLDPRDHAWRADLADIALADRIVVANYAAPARRVADAQVPVLAAPDAAATAVSELLPGEEFAVLDDGAEFAWGYAVRDGYVGHVASAALVAPPATGELCQVGPGDALLFAAADLRAAVVATLPAAAQVRVQPGDGDFRTIAHGRHAGACVHRRHLLTDAERPDWVAAAETFLAAPYRWGGRSRQGIDCSGLVQVARQLAGFHCRRDSDMICADAGVDVAAADARRGDLACWPGHIGILLDAATLLHANAHWMRCVAEPLADVVARAAAAGRPAPPRLRRFPPA